MLRLENVSAYYGPVQSLWDVSLEAGEGELVAVVGANASGKTTTAKCISGLIRNKTGQIIFEGQRIEHAPAHRIVELGIVLVPSGRQLFPFMSTEENLELGAYAARARHFKKESLQEVYGLLPILKERRRQLAGSLSGGEQQMCAIARGLMARPKLLLLDEPSLGLAPVVVREVYEVIMAIRGRGIPVLFVEQNIRHALSIADRGYVLSNGRVALQGAGSLLLRDDRLTEACIGVR